MLKPETIGTVRERERERELQSSKIGFCFGTQKHVGNILTVVKRNIRQKLYACEDNTCA